MSEFLQHIASEGDRWDSIAYAYYGDATAYGQIIVANKHLPITTTLQAGQIVFVPIIKRTQRTDAPVPPWLQSEQS